MLKKIRFYGLLFGIGGVGYCFIELLWRGFTDISMAFAGGTALCLLAVIQKVLKPVRFLYRCVLGGLTITAVEMAFGTVFNLWLNRNVWDYSQMPLNILGQVCLLYTVLWCFLSVPMLMLTDILRQKFLPKDRKDTRFHPSADREMLHIN